MAKKKATSKRQPYADDLLNADALANGAFHIREALELLQMNLSNILNNEALTAEEKVHIAQGTVFACNELQFAINHINDVVQELKKP